MAKLKLGYKFLLAIQLLIVSCLTAQEADSYVAILKDSLILSRHEKGLPINIFQVKKWKFSIEDKPQFAEPGFDDSKWPVTNISGFIDSLSTEMKWNNFVWLRLTIVPDSAFFTYPWWLYYYSVSPAEIYINGKLIAAFGTPSTQKKGEILPVFLSNQPQFKMLPVIKKQDKIVVAIRWSAHHAFAITSLFPGTFKEYGPIMVLQSSDPAPQWQQDMKQSYLRVFFGAGLLFLVIGIQAFSWWYTKSTLNRGIFFVSLFLLAHLIASHPYVFGYSLMEIVVDVLLFTPLFILLFLLFPWLAASMLNLPFQLSAKKYSAIILSTLVIALLLLLFKGADFWGYLALLLGTIFISFIWLVSFIIKAYKQKIKYRGIVALTYITPLGIVLFAFSAQVIGKFAGFDLNSFLQTYNLFSLLIILVYTSIPILTTFYIARQNIDLLGNLSYLVKERTNELESSIKELKETQAQLIQKEKMASLGELTAGIAHEIQNPLNFVNNFSEVSKELIEEVKGERLKLEGERNEELEEELLNDIAKNLEKINHHGKRADSIVKGMLQHSRSSAGKMEPTDINALCDEYLRLAYHGLKAKDKNFESSFYFLPDNSLPKVNVVPQDIGRVLLNLINNAFQAAAVPSGLDRTGSASGYSNPDIIHVPKVWVTTKYEGGNVHVSVRDNGPGIPDTIKDKIFQPFFTTKPTGQGTGLGLSLSYDIVKAHAGAIMVETKAGEGAVFTIQIPTA